METQEQTRARLRGILDRIGPGMSLGVDERFLVAAFGSKDTTKEAEAFAHSNHCAFEYSSGKNHGDGVGVFIRAYPKEIHDLT